MGEQMKKQLSMDRFWLITGKNSQRNQWYQQPRKTRAVEVGGPIWAGHQKEVCRASVEETGGWISWPLDVLSGCRLVFQSSLSWTQSESLLSVPTTPTAVAQRQSWSSQASFSWGGRTLSLLGFRGQKWRVGRARVRCSRKVKGSCTLERSFRRGKKTTYVPLSRRAKLGEWWAPLGPLGWRMN
jgi:hypothetical protein